MFAMDILDVDEDGFISYDDVFGYLYAISAVVTAMLSQDPRVKQLSLEEDLEDTLNRAQHAFVKVNTYFRSLPLLCYRFFLGRSSPKFIFSSACLCPHCCLNLSLWEMMCRRLRDK